MARLPCLHCYIPGASGLAAGQKLALSLKTSPWLAPDKTKVASCRVFIPKSRATELEGVANAEKISISPNLTQDARDCFHKVYGHVFIGACGIAVRIIAPCLRHKSLDPPVIVIDPLGRYVISLLSGHWGGGNSLALHISRLLAAEPVLTTESDACHQPALDLFLQDNGMRIIDWSLLPAAQSAISQGLALPLEDPLKLLPGCHFLIKGKAWGGTESRKMPLVAVDIHKRQSRPNVLRTVPAILHLGIGFRRHASINELAEALKEFLDFYKLEECSICSIATITGKGEPLKPLADCLSARLLEFPPDMLARVSAPHPSRACGKRFGKNPFSVCEGAALLSASNGKQNESWLVVEKHIWNRSVTFALAVSGPQKLASHIKERVK